MKVVKIFLGLFFFLLTAGLVVGGAGFYWAAQEINKPGAFDKPVEIIIAPGSSVGGIAEQLSHAGAVESPLLFRAAGRYTGQDSKLKAGEYEIPPHASIRDILNLLESGKTVQRKVTLREGLTNHEIKLALAEKGDLKQIETPMKPEGSYLPETYSYTREESNADILRRMAEAMDQAFAELWDKRAADLPFTTKAEALTLASIVEKETGQKEERARVAGVFINRLKRGMPLQSDPTVIYALNMGEHQNEGQGPLGRRLLKKDLEIDSPYNTYVRTGLPPAPIANPGRASIEAVLNPERHEFLYFVADGTGGHFFAATLEEHNRNVAKWRTIRANSGD